MLRDVKGVILSEGFSHITFSSSWPCKTFLKAQVKEEGNDVAF